MLSWMNKWPILGVWMAVAVVFGACGAAGDEDRERDPASATDVGHADDTEQSGDIEQPEDVGQSDDIEQPEDVGQSDDVAVDTGDVSGQDIEGDPSADVDRRVDCDLSEDGCTARLIPLWTAQGQVHGFAEGGDGTLYVGGSFRSLAMPADTNSMGSFALSDGQVDLDWPGVNGTVAAFASDGSGGLYLGGTFTHVGGEPRASLAHVRADGTLTSWNPAVDGSLADLPGYENVKSIAVRDGIVYVAGDLQQANGEARRGFAAFDADGQLLEWDPASEMTAFGTGIRRVLVVGDVLFVGGRFNQIVGEERTALAAFDLDHQLLPFAPQIGASSTPSVTVLTHGGDTLYFGGAFDSVGGETRARLGAVTLDGEVTPWNPPEVVGTFEALLWHAGRIYLAGQIRFSEGDGSTNRARVLAFSGEDQGDVLDWHVNLARSISFGLPIGGESLGLHPVSDGILIVGEFEHVFFDGDRGTDGTVGSLPTRYNAALVGFDGELRAWRADVLGSANAAFTLGDHVIIGGRFEVSEIVHRAALAAFRLDGTITDFDAGATGSLDRSHYPSVWGLLWHQGLLYVGGDFSSIGGQARPGLAALSAAGEASAWSPEPSGSRGLRQIALGDSRIHVGLLGQQNTPNLRSLQSFDVASGAPGWGASGFGVRSLLAADGQLFVGGSFRRIAGEDREDFAVFGLDGQITEQTIDFDDSFFNGNPRLDTLAWMDDTLYISGRFTGIGGESRPGFAAFDRAGALTGLAADWDHARVSAMAAGGGWIFLGTSGPRDGLLEDDAGQSHFLVAMDPTGTVVPWAPQARSITSLHWVNGLLFAEGTFELDSGEAFRGWVLFTFSE